MLSSLVSIYLIAIGNKISGKITKSCGNAAIQVRHLDALLMLIPIPAKKKSPWSNTQQLLFFETLNYTFVPLLVRSIGPALCDNIRKLQLCQKIDFVIWML